MPIQRFSNIDTYTFIDAPELVCDSGEVSLEMGAKCQKIRDHNYPGRASCNERSDRVGKSRRGTIQERRFDPVSRPSREFCSDCVDCIIRRLYRRAVSE